MADFGDPSDIADGKGKGVKDEIEVSSVNGQKENTGLGTDLGCVWGCGEHNEFSIYVSRLVPETILDTEGQGNTKKSLSV